LSSRPRRRNLRPAAPAGMGDAMPDNGPAVFLDDDEAALDPYGLLGRAALELMGLRPGGWT